MTNVIAPDAMQHLNYQTGMFLTSGYMTLEQNYFSNWLRLQNQYLYTPGVLSGMLVTQQNNALAVAQGVAFDALGNFLVLAANNGNPVAVPPNPSNPFYVYAYYPATAVQQTPVVNAAAQLGAANIAPPNAVVLASVAVDQNYMITQVTDMRTPVRSLLPANLSNSNVRAENQVSQVNLNQALQGSVNVPTAALQSAGASTSVTVYYLGSEAAAFSAAPMVMASVQGGTPYALAVAPGTSSFVLSLTAVQAAAPGVTGVNINWLAVANL